MGSVNGQSLREEVDRIKSEFKRLVKGKFPSDMPGSLQYGTGLKAYIINLLICQMLSLNRAQKLIKTLIGRMISEASLLQFILRLHYALEQWESAAISELLNSPAINVDETLLRVDKKNQWIHVYSAGDVTLKLLHQKRGGEAINVRFYIHEQDKQCLLQVL